MSPPLLLLLLALWLGGGPGPLSPPGPGSAAALKLENYHDPETGRADPEVKESLQLRQPRFLFRVKRKIPYTTNHPLPSNSKYFRNHRYSVLWYDHHHLHTGNGHPLLHHRWNHR